MGNSKFSSKREVYSDTGLPQETRNISNKQSDLTPKGNRKRRIRETTTSQKKKRNNNDQRGNRDSLIHQRADSRSKKNYNRAACGTKTTFTER